MEEPSGYVSIKFLTVRSVIAYYSLLFILFSLSESTDYKGRIKSVRKFGVLQLIHIKMGQGIQKKTVFKLPVEITLVIGLVST